MAKSGKWVSGDFKICITEARGFLDTAEWCLPKAITSTRMKYPFVVNISFACELFLKAIMIRESDDGTFAFGHDLEKLFQKLNPDTQAKIKEAYETQAKDSLHETKLEQFLENSKHNFENWRYAFAKDGLSTNGSSLLYFSHCLSQYVKTLEEEE